MLLVRRRLFWKVYLTLLASLVLVTILIGWLWWLTSGNIGDRLGPLRVHLTDLLATEHGTPAGALSQALERLGGAVGADISVYDREGRLTAARGEPVMLPSDDDEQRGRWQNRLVRFDLPDGRVVMARMHPPPRPPGLRILMLMAIVAGGVGVAAFPVTARLTRRLEDLRSGVAAWGEGAMHARVAETGSDEVAAVARTFNAAAARVEGLVAAQKALLANASHELRSPLARLRMAAEIFADRPGPAAREEIQRNLAEVDQLVDEILLASRLDHPDARIGRASSIDLLGLAAEEAARVDAALSGTPVEVMGDATLLRRLIRNLLENAVKHGAPPVEITAEQAPGGACLTVADRGRGIPEAERQRVFEPFYRPVGRSEAAGGWGLGLSLVRQIALAHGGRVRCEPRSGGGTLFVVDLPAGGA
ncbi:HAMP domain-containing sensor histidine kinase [Labrys wisconsinensis]|uniref:histidine kinase n=1 Tax=Labrys wisconsinensis TaxID=425677 RepID=A0ABU0IYV5_9HYPH|nr:HAMP domain-containing sensor histidine kinase [Labrys wisconsinensis]MDQ0467186.1 signal transduction histidine kinase [Labrys wisconsinensis]